MADVEAFKIVGFAVNIEDIAGGFGSYLVNLLATEAGYDLISSVAYSIHYDGFDAVEVMREVIRRIQKHLKVVFADYAEFISNPKAMEIIIAALIILCVRGGSFFQALKGLTPANKLKLTSVRNALGIAENVRGAQPSTVLTLPRLGTLFAPVCFIIKAHYNQYTRDPFPKEFVGLPHWCRQLGLAGAFPNANDKEYKLYVEWCIKFDALIAQRKSTEDNPVKADPERVRQFAETQRKSSLFGDVLRVNIWKTAAAVVPLGKEEMEAHAKTGLVKLKKDSLFAT